MDSAQPLGRALLDDLLTEARADTVDLAVALIAAQPPQAWPAQASLASQRLGIDATQLTHQLVAQVQTWNSDPARAAANAIAEFAQRPTATQAPPPPPWVSLADRVDPRLTSEPDWPALAHMLTAIHDNGADPVRLVHQAMAEGPLDNMPAQDLRYRLVALHQLPATPYNEPEPTRHTAQPAAGQPPACRARSTTPVGTKPLGKSRCVPSLTPDPDGSTPNRGTAKAARLTDMPMAAWPVEPLGRRF